MGARSTAFGRYSCAACLTRINSEAEPQGYLAEASLPSFATGVVLWIQWEGRKKMKCPKSSSENFWQDFGEVYRAKY